MVAGHARHVQVVGEQCGYVVGVPVIAHEMIVARAIDSQRNADAGEAFRIEENAGWRHHDGSLDAGVGRREFPAGARDARRHPTAICGAELVVLGMLLAMHAP